MQALGGEGLGAGLREQGVVVPVQGEGVFGLGVDEGAEALGGL